MAGTLTISNLSDGTNTGSVTDAIKGSAKAWVNFNLSSTPTIAASYNVSSVTYVTTSQFSVNFTSGFSDTSYVTLGAVSHANYNSYNFGGHLREDSIRRTKTTSACPISYYDTINGQITPAGTCNAHIAFYR